MLKQLISELEDIGPPIEEMEAKTGFPAWSTLCKVGSQVSEILQHSGKIEDFLDDGSIIDPRKCTTISFQTNYGDFGGGYHYIKSDNGVSHSELFNDAEFFLALDYDGIIIAFIGFDIDGEGNPEVKQIQGANLFGKSFSRKINHNGFLKKFRWKEYLVTELIYFIKNNKIGSKVKIQSARNNHWLNGKKGYQTYDQVALDLGFKGDTKMGYTMEIKKDS